MTALLAADEAARLRPGEQLVIVRAGEKRQASPPGHAYMGYTWFVAPQAWVALTGPCEVHSNQEHCKIVGCMGWGRLIVPLHTECRWCKAKALNHPHREVGHSGRVLVGRGSIEVVPVVSESDNRHLDPPFIEVTDQGLCVLFANANDVRNVRQITLDPLPVPGRDWGIAIDCVETP